MNPSATVEALRSAQDRENRDLRRDVVQLAARVTSATRKLKSVVAEKERVGRMLDSVLEGIDAGVVLLSEEDAVLAANWVARDMGVIDGDNKLCDVLGQLSPLESEQLIEPSPGTTWLARVSSMALEPGRQARLFLVQDVTAVMGLQRQAQRRSRLELVGRMAAELAHEIRNPLGSLELFASMLCEELADDPRREELAEPMLMGVRQLSQTVSRLLSAARERRTKRTKDDAVALAEQTLRFVQPVAQSRQIELEMRAKDRPLAIQVDPEGLRQALLNLLTNALDHTPEGGRIELEVVSARSGVVFAVSDSGPGVDASQRERIFEPFYTTRNDGNGLGLALVERIAMNHGGCVSVGESPHGGARFELFIANETSLPEDPKEKLKDE